MSRICWQANGRSLRGFKREYDLTDREELAILQICMDRFPLFKDRGTISGKDEKDSLRQIFLKLPYRGLK